MCITRLVWALALYVGSSGLAIAAPENITDGELALTPPYCQDVQGIKWGDASYNPSPRAAYWVGLMGKSFWAMHHYCWGLISTRRALAAGVAPVIRRGLLESAVNDYGYVVKNSTPDFVLLPEIYTRIGETQLLLGSSSAAYDAFARARSIKPDYWPPYVRWAEVLVKTGRKKEAKALLADGLRYSPDAKPLIEEYRRLGGNPAEVQQLPPEPKAAASSAAGLPPAPAASAPSS